MDKIFEINEDNLENFCEFINDVITEAIDHGGDGEAYCRNQANLERAIHVLVYWTGLEKYVAIYKADYPRLIIKSKISD